MTTFDATSPYSSKLRVDSRRLKSDFLADGNLTKPAWRAAKWIRFDHDWAGKRRYPGIETRVASRWTTSQVYFAYRCKYSVLNVYPDQDPAQEKWGLWERDVVEVFINPRPERVNQYYEFEVSPNNLRIDLAIDLAKKPFNDASWNSGFLHATRIGKTVWTCEMRIPVAAMAGNNYEPGPKTEWRVNFYRADGRGDDTQRHFLAWSPTLTPQPQFHAPTRFGLLRFVI
jgi:hypothetical protein